MILTEQNLLNAPDMKLELTYQWEGMSFPDTIQVWYDNDEDVYKAKFYGYAVQRFRHFGSLLSWLGLLPQLQEWC